MSYERLYRGVYSRPRLVVFLKALSIVCTCLAVIAFLYIGVIAFWIGFDLGVKYLLITGIPFVLVTLLRRIASAPRPYEVVDFLSENAPRKKAGDSFPSRHVFSAFVISFTVCHFANPIGIATLVFGIAIGACRVLLGIHFVRDVVAGAVIGILSAILGLWIFL